VLCKFVPVPVSGAIRLVQNLPNGSKEPKARAHAANDAADTDKITFIILTKINSGDMVRHADFIKVVLTLVPSVVRPWHRLHSFPQNSKRLATKQRTSHCFRVTKPSAVEDFCGERDADR
jgi:hypothetical protein